MADEYIDNLIEKGVGKYVDFTNVMMWFLDFAQCLEDKGDLIENYKE